MKFTNYLTGEFMLNKLFSVLKENFVCQQKASFLKTICTFTGILIFILGLQLFSHAQVGGRYNNWYFGYNSALTWNNGGVPVSLNDNAMHSEEGCAAISDINGNLLFYTNGIKVWNSSHEIIAEGLMGGPSSAQAALIIPKPLNPDVYYIFTTPDWGRGYMYYREVTINGNVVTVENENHLIYGQADVSEKITATCTGNENELWVISHEAHTDAFIFIKVTSSGPVLDHLQHIGIVHDPSWYTSPGQIKVSHDGTKLGIANYFGRRFEVYDFDKSNGLLSNLRFIQDASNVPWGIEFSPDLQKVYIGNDPAGSALKQYVIHPTYLELTYSANISGSFGLRTLQLHTDGKIYANTAFDHVDIINNPNVIGAGCSFVTPGIQIQYIPGQYPSWTPSGLANNPWIWCDAGLEINATVTNVLCFGKSTGAIDLTVTGGNFPLSYSYSWNNGATTQDLVDIAAGTYSVTVTDPSGLTATYTATVTEPQQLSIDAGVNQMVYYGYRQANCATLTWSGASGGVEPYDIVWSTGQTTQTITVCPTSTTFYSVTITDANNCAFTDEVKVCVADIRSGKGKDFGKKVLICHNTGSKTNPHVTIDVDTSAVQAHLTEHGDVLGPCELERTCSDSKSFSEDVNNPDGSENIRFETYPNPFSGTATITFSCPVDGYVTINLVDYTGKDQALLFTQNVKKDVQYQVELDGTHLTQGLYFCILKHSDGTMKVRKLIYIK
jgi:hypothetical protein